MPTFDQLPDTFGPALRYLRKRARLTQEEFGRAVGYSREQIARLENSSRLPDLAVVAALFVPALRLERDRQLVEQFLTLAGQTRQPQQVTLTRRRETRVQIVQETVSIPTQPTHRPPAPLLPLLGRATEVADLLARLADSRLITLVGAPGIGKTRLALEVARLAIDRFADGVAFVSLAEIAAPEDIAYAVLTALDLTPAAQEAPADVISDYLSPRRLLLVIDNCEHLLEGVTVLADWLAAAPDLSVLCTSRVPLDLYGEQEWPVSPLAVPDLANLPDLAYWREYPALQLLVARAQAADPTFTVTTETLLPLATLCVALDGLPLALELAAVRLRDLSPASAVQELLQMRGRDHLSSTWLQQTRRNVADRHRTLQAAIAWSAQRLPAATQQAFYRLGVFANGCTKEAALAIAGAGHDERQQLAHASLLRQNDDRIQLLETLRAFGEEQLTAGHELVAARRAHADHYAGFALDVFDGMRGGDQATWMQRALTDHDNCLAALRWALEQNDGDTAVAIAGRLWWFWYRRGFFQLGRDLLTSALELPSSDLPGQARALNGLASFYLIDEDYSANLACHERGLAIRRQLGDREGIATALHNMGLTAFTMGDFAQARIWLLESTEVYPEEIFSACAHLGLIAQETQDLVAARYWLEQAYAAVADNPDSWSKAFVMNFLADVLREAGEYDEAARLANESLRLFAALDDPYYLPDAQLTLAQIALDQADWTTAEALATMAFTQYEARGDTLLMASTLLVKAEIAARRENRVEATSLFAQARQLRQSVTRAMTPRETAHAATVERLLATLIA